MEEYNNFTQLSATAMEPEWDQHDPSFLAQAYTLLKTGGFLRERPEKFRGRFVAGMHTNPCKSLRECRDKNLENVLTAHITVSSFRWQASTQIQPTDPTDIE